MKIVTDLHIHSKYSRAVSRDMVLEKLDAWADDKGIKVMGTGDFTHPAWIKEIKEKLEPAEPGLFKLRDKFKEKTLKGTLAETRFMLTTEVSSIYSRGGRTRRVHNLIFAPSIAAVEKINKELGRIGNLKSDGRPIIGIDSEDLLKLVLECSPSTSSGTNSLGSPSTSSGTNYVNNTMNNGAVLVPAHIWTPWFAMFGSMSGFDSIEECFGDYAKYIFAIETGLSSDPPMNWRVSSLDRVALISNSDSHSLERIGRECNVFECELSYGGIMGAIRNGIAEKKRQGNSDKRQGRFLETIEFYPEEGRYHVDGHRLCGIAWTPKETEKHGGICTKCGQKVTIGTLNRLGQIADRAEGYSDEFRVPFRRLVQLDKIIGEALDLGPKTKSVKKIYDKLIMAFGSELGVLLDAAPQKIAMASSVTIAEGVSRVREGKLIISPGYDGEYGTVKIFNSRDRKKFDGQRAMF